MPDVQVDFSDTMFAQVLNAIQERHSEMDKLHFALCLKQMHNYYTKLNMADEKLGIQFGSNLRKNAVFKVGQYIFEIEEPSLFLYRAYNAYSYLIYIYIYIWE